jgi:hypothetical protein
MTYPDPYLSIVVTSRNDDHGQSLLRRMQTFVNALIGQCKRHGLQAELIIVEWNPPQERPRFIEALRWPEKTDPCQVRIIEVPPELHRRLRHSENLPLFQMIAKNVGIRRARGRFILATNIDILLSDELVRALARGELRNGRMYRIDRHDVMTDVPVFADVNEQLRYCETHLLRTNCREGTFELTPEGVRTAAFEDIATAEMGVSFESGWYPVERWHGEVYRWVGEGAVLAVSVPDGLRRALCLEVEPGPGVRQGPFEMQVRDPGGQVLARGQVECRQFIYLSMPLPAGQLVRLQLHTVGGGRPIAFDPRILNFRVMKCCWAEEAPSHTHPARCAGEGMSLLTTDDVERLHFEARDAYILATEDIATPELGLRFGRGWHGFERWDGEPFRWVGNDAGLAITLPNAAAPVLRLEIEPGPGVENRPFWLQVRDTVGRTLARGFIGGRQFIDLTLPLIAGQTHYFQLHTEGGGRPIPNSPRILNFRVLHFAWVDNSENIIPDGVPAGTFRFGSGDVFQVAKADIAAADRGIRFGRGWYQVECNHGVLSRWVGEDATIALNPPASSDQILSLELQPGPGVGHCPFTLQVQDRAGQTIAQGLVSGREIVHLMLPLGPGEAQYFRLRVLNGGRRIPSDPRILNFHAFRCFWSQNWQKIPALAQPDDAYNLKTEDVYLLADKDIVTPDMGIRFGRGWYPAEINHGIVSRWVGDDAGIAVRAPSDAENILSLELQPGPGVDQGPFTLQVQDRAGRTVAQGLVEGREIVHLQLLLRPGQIQYFRLHVLGGGHRIPSDPRILNFNVLRCFWSKNWEGIDALPQPEDAHHIKTEDVSMVAETDIAAPEMGLRFGRGWYPVELRHGVPYRWVGDDAAFTLAGREGAGWVLSLEVGPGPGVGKQAFVLRVDDANRRTVAQGLVDDHRIVHLHLPLRPGHLERFWLRAEGGGKRIAADSRILNFHVSRCYWSQDWETIPLSNQPPDAFNFKTSAPDELAEEDIAAAGMGLRFGTGWYPVERQNGSPHRWAGEDAGLTVDTPEGSARVLSLEIQPGPGVECRLFNLEVLDAGGQTVAQGAVAGHKVVHLLLPLHKGQTGRFRLHTPDGGRRITTDPRILNFTVFRCSWTEDWEGLVDFSQPLDAFNFKTEDPYVLASEDIAPAEMGLRFGPGWHGVERSPGGRSRWAGENASLAVKPSQASVRDLCLELAPGPGVDYRPFTLQVQDALGQPLARVGVKGRQVVQLPLPLHPDRTERFWLHAEGGGRRTVGDPRILNFNVFRFFWSEDPSPSNAAPSTNGVHSNGAASLNGSNAETSRAGDGVVHPVDLELDFAPVEHDIAPADIGLRFSAGWGRLEEQSGESYRCVRNGAQFTIQENSDTPVKTLSLNLEPAPDLAGLDLAVQVLDSHGRVLAHEAIAGRQWVHLMLPVQPWKVKRFQLHLTATPSTEGDEEDRALRASRAALLRIFGCRWSRPDAIVPEQGIISPLPLHTCACGDFTLLAREDWFELRGYPEFELFSLHIDSVFCYQAHHHGVVEEVLPDPMRIYHIEHGTGSGWTPEGAAKLMERIAAKGIACLECQEVLAWATEMRRRNRPLVFNDENWGLPADVLPETVVGQASC